jgi:ArsR family transcriptional regulator
MDEITALQADVLRALAYPRRLQILHRLADGPAEVGILAAELGISQPNASQHLSVMRAAGVVEAERIGREVQYRVSDPDLIDACQTMRRVLERRYDRLASLAAGLRMTVGDPTGAATASTVPSDER